MGIYNASRFRYTANQNVVMLSIMPIEAITLKRIFELIFFMIVLIMYYTLIRLVELSAWYLIFCFLFFELWHYSPFAAQPPMHHH